MNFAIFSPHQIFFMQISLLFFSSPGAETNFATFFSSPEAEKLPSLGRETKNKLECPYAWPPRPTGRQQA